MTKPHPEQLPTQSGRAGYAQGMSKTPWDKEAAARVQSAAARNPDSASARDQLDREAQSQAAKNENEEDDC
uniref:hypothetical protein n=1 Tax=Streptosporangium sp. CA-256172 TaxID=3240076 RepID=UPI003F4984B1